MGMCCQAKNLNLNHSIINVNELKSNNNLNSNNEKTSQLNSEDCSILISSLTNDINYKVKYKESNIIIKLQQQMEKNNNNNKFNNKNSISIKKNF
jgi:hypothetical protein